MEPRSHRRRWAHRAGGFWQLYELDAETTIGEFGTRVRVRGGLADLLRSLGERDTVARTLAALRRHVHVAKLKRGQPGVGLSDAGAQDTRDTKGAP